MLFTGRLTAKAELKAVKGDKQVINFTVAINQKWKNKAGEKKEKTAFVDCAYWRNSGIAEYLTKGAVVEISGWMEAQGYQSKSDGIKARLNCTCDTIKLFSLTAKSEQATDTKTKKKVTAGASNQPDDNDLPFQFHSPKLFTIHIMVYDLNYNSKNDTHSFFSVKEKAWHGLGQIVEQ